MLERTNVKDDGFYGIFHPAAKPFNPKQVVIVVGGSEGNENIPLNVGAMFAERGISALGICYWNVAGLLDNLIGVPIDPIQKAITWLKKRGFEKIAMYGISKGAELTLLCASLMPEITAVVAVSPIHCVWSGMKGNKKMLAKSFATQSEFTYQGKDFPCMQAKLKYGPAIRHLLTQRQFNLRYIYEEPLKNFDERTAIAVEKINGDILFIYAEQDLMWPSKEAVDYMENRLRTHDFPHEVKKLGYEKASHILVPLNPKHLKMFRVERKFPAECKRNREEAFRETLQWLKER